jgi:hypothetical protein
MEGNQMDMFNFLWLIWDHYLLVMSSSWNFPAWAEPSYEGSEPSRAGALQFPSWNRADNTENMYVKK